MCSFLRAFCNVSREVIVIPDRSLIMQVRLIVITLNPYHLLHFELVWCYDRSQI